MSRRRASAGLAALLVTLSATAPAARQEQATHPIERPISTGGEGPRRLRVDVTLLAGARGLAGAPADVSRHAAGTRLADLRLVDAGGREIPYLLVDNPPHSAVWRAGTILPVAATAKTSGFELDLGATALVDALTIEGLPAPYMKRLRLEGSGDRTRWTILAAQATVFDLPEERVRQTSVAFLAGSYRYLRVTWDDASSARLPLPRRSAARESAARPAPAPVRADVSIERQPSEPRRSRYRLQLPARALPVAAVLLEAGEGDVFRTVSVTEARFGGRRADPIELGRARLVRAEHGRDAGPFRLPIDAPRGSELQLVVEDGDNPPLSIARAAIELAELPWIYFEAPAGTVTARYGDPAARAPQYDLEARRAAVRIDDLPEAAWGEPRPLARAEARPAGTAAPARGAAVDPGAYRYQRAIPEGPDGLVALTLDAAVLAHSRGPLEAFADVRVIDAQSHQIPYLLERRDEPLSEPLVLRPGSSQVSSITARTGGQRSLYALTLPYAGLPEPRLALETSDRVFRRTIQVGIERPADRRHRDAWFDVLATAAWEHAEQAVPAPALQLSIAPGRDRELLMVVEEGDNRPLTIVAARLLLPLWRLRFFRPAAPLRLVYGVNADVAAAPPQYDLALVAPAVMGADAQPVTALPEAGAVRDAPAILSPRTFWIFLAAAVAILLALIVRLMAAGTH